MPSKQSSKLKIGAVVLLLAAVTVAAAWSLAGNKEPAKQSTLPSHLSVDALKQNAGNRTGLRDALRDESLTDEQRRELRRNMRAARRSAMQERMDAYFAAAEQDRQAILDQHIDEFQSRMKQWENRSKAEKKEDQERREEFRSQFFGRSKQERKANSESRNPDQTAQRMGYMTAVRGRMAQRGISMPGRGSGGRGRGR